MTTNKLIESKFSGLPQNLPVNQRKLNICIASSDAMGPIRNGGIGTAYYFLSTTLASQGHNVTFLYGYWNICEDQNMDYWIAHYKQKGVNLVSLPALEYPLESNMPCQKSYETYQWLLKHKFDIIHFPEMGALGYYSILAKKINQAFSKTILCVSPHSPTLWHKLNNDENPKPQDFELDFMERYCIQNADIVIAQCNYILKWMKDNNWKLPPKTYVQPNIITPIVRSSHSSPELIQPTELVFFGRLEPRKGLVYFCDALDILSKQNILTSVTFLGRPTMTSIGDSVEYIKKRSEKWSLKVNIITDFNQPQANQYLKQGKKLTIIPSITDLTTYTLLECLNLQVPLLASNRGGIPDGIHQDDREKVLFNLNPKEIADKIQNAIKLGISPPRPAIDFAANIEAWLTWHNSILSYLINPEIKQISNDEPLVSICILHRNRPGLLKQALESIKLQTYKNYEIILVDDGSDQPEAINYIEELKQDFQMKGWTLHTGPQQYPRAARNFAVKSARGKYILFMDDDNYAKSHELSTMVSIATQTSSDIITCFMDKFDGNNPPQVDQKPLVRKLILGAAPIVGMFWNCFGDTNSLIKKDVFTSIGGFPENETGQEDWEFFASAVLRGHSLIVIPEALFWYRISADSFSKSTKQISKYRILEPYKKLLPESLTPLLLLATSMHQEYWHTRSAYENLILRARSMKAGYEMLHKMWIKQNEKSQNEK